MLDVAVTVAMAFQEHNEPSAAPADDGAGVIKSLIARLMGDKKQGHPLSHAQISASRKKKALYTLSESLGYTGFLA